MRINWIIILLLLPGLSVLAQERENWEMLFNGKNLDGWERLNGKAPYTIEGDIVVGTTVKNTPNTFLATKKTYSDFILEYEVLADNRLNSGVQIRSNSFKAYKDGRAHGYQVEIDPSSRSYSGGIYDEARRGWLYPLAANPKGRQAFRRGEWNRFRVEAIGNRIRTWINGTMCSNLVDAMTAEGFVALQVHSIYKDDQANTQVKWRNIRITTENLEAVSWPADPEVQEISYLTNELTETEKRKGYRLLWDGRSSKGWKGAKMDGFPTSGWEMKDGILTVFATDGGESTGPGDIITTEQFGDFELELEFQITAGANSGIKYFVDPGLNTGAGSAIGCEFQLLDDAKHPDAKKGVAGNRTLGSLYDLMTAENLSIPDRRKTFNGIGTWNKARIISKGGKVEHWLNNEKVIEYDRFSQMFLALVNYSKYKDWPNFGRWPEGHILLQDHGDTVHFRSIKIREF
ncbi:DUF1080 domain-containing protein [Fulvivirga sp. M361]|uniref:3-keto-disaccharide hydrolase n=1 Tax=Fulvivirga sp. M361 TaxID=2594266 RepID=UPI001179EDAF|nr:DUF1080 domain-containing protein [Fulvivirga sp. M361]TRX53060.1 DUF1080 domain-containing protein [Fulvivirga sp. M361]